MAEVLSTDAVSVGVDDATARQSAGSKTDDQEAADLSRITFICMAVSEDNLSIEKLPREF